MGREAIHIRKLTTDDLAAVSRIDEKITGKDRRDLWVKRLDAYEGIRPPWACLVVCGPTYQHTSGWKVRR